MTVRRTGRWNVPLLAGLFAIGVGVLLAEPTLLLLAVPALAFTAYGHLTPDPPAPTTLEIERSLDDASPSHGQPVTVTTTVRNTGANPIFDLRVADGVPRLLPVERGVARHATVLGPGEETTFSYTLIAKHGVHRFEPASVLVRDPAGSTVREAALETDTELACLPSVRTLPVDHGGRFRSGSTADTSGSGLEFATVRDYRRGDPLRRIDWNRYARSGELSTVSFREDRSSPVVCCLDARGCCYRASDADDLHAVAYGTAAVQAVLTPIAERGSPVGLAVVSAAFEWISPARGDAHVETVRRTLADPDAVPVDPSLSDRRWRDVSFRAQLRILRRRIDRDVGIVLVSPLFDAAPVAAARTLTAAGYSVTVLSPDTTTNRSRGTELERLRRDNRIAQLRRGGIDVIDWPPEQSLEAAIRRGCNRSMQRPRGLNL